MKNTTSKVKVTATNGSSYETKFIELHQITMIDEALNLLGDYGEVRLVVEKGRLRFLVTQRSFDALQWQPGKITG